MRYEKPTVEDYGTLRELTAMAFPGLPAGMATISSPTGPPGGPPGGPPPGGGDTPGLIPSGGGDLPGDTPDNGLSGGEQASGGGGGGVAGAEAGGGSGGTASTGGGDAALPFTGFAAAMVATVGAGMAATGAALRRVLRRNKPQP